VKSQARVRFGKGVRLRRDPDGRAVLLVPEGALFLNTSASATLELLDGKRTLADVATILVERFEVGEEQARNEVSELLERLAERRLVEEV
jgi:pyrroloquinoline quinone biosynthesis protein D